MKNFDLKNVDCHATLGMIEKRWGFPRRTLRALLGMTKNAQSGRSMIEMLGVLAIIGVLSVGGIAGYSKAMQKYRINKMIEQITLIAGNVRAFFAPQKNYIGVACGSYADGSCEASGCNGHAGFDYEPGYGEYPITGSNGCPVIKKAKILPDEMITVTNNKITGIINPFGYGFRLFSTDKAKELDNQAFAISFWIGDNIEACIELLTQDWTNANINFIQLTELKGMGNSSFTLPASVDNAVNVCSHADAKGIDGPTYITFYLDADINYYKDLLSDDTWY